MKNPIERLSESELRQHILGNDPLPLAVVAAIAECAMQAEIDKRNKVRMVPSPVPDRPEVPLLRTVC